MKKETICAASKGSVIARIYDYLFPDSSTDNLRDCMVNIEHRIKDGKKVVVLKATERRRP